MAHEFSPYRGAIGPEGVRRTTMHYGPVVGGLPIEAWHCEVCGLLRLDYPDGRKEERRLFPGPQPGLLAFPVAGDIAPEQFSGMQARVSGLSAPPEMMLTLLPVEEGPAGPGLAELVARLPRWDPATWLTVALLTASMCGLILGGALAVYDWTTDSRVTPLFWSVLGTFFGAIAVQVIAAAQRHWFPMPRLAPSPASIHGGRPQIDAVTGLVVALLSLVTAGLILGGALAVYDWKTPDYMSVVIWAVAVLFFLAIAVKVVDAALRHLQRR